MEINTFKRCLNVLNAIHAEERYINQRMLDNHLFSNSEKGFKYFNKIYDEFESIINKEIKLKRIEIKISEEEQKKRWKKMIGKLKGE